MKKRSLLALPLLALAGLSLMSCGEDKAPTTGTVPTTIPSTAPTSTPSTAPTSTPTTTPTESKRLSRISLDYTDAKVTYILGEELSLDGLVVTARYADGTSQKFTSDFTEENGFSIETDYNGNEKGDYVVKIIYTENGQTKTSLYYTKVISILESLNKYLIGIIADTSNVKMEYKYKEEFTSENLVVTAYYSDSTSRVLNQGEYTVDSSLFDNENLGTNHGFNEIKVYYNETYTSGTHSEVINADTCYFTTLLLTMTRIQYGGGGTRVFNQYSDVSTAGWMIRVYYQEKGNVYDVITEGYTTDISTMIKDANNPTNDLKVTITYSYNGVTCTNQTTCSVKAYSAAVLPGAIDLTNKQLTAKKLDDVFTLLPGYSVISDTSSCGTQAFARAITLDGSGTLQENAIKVTLTAGASINVCAASYEGTLFGLYDANGDAVVINGKAQTVNAGTDNVRYSFTAPTAGTYYIWCSTAISIYFVGVWY